MRMFTRCLFAAIFAVAVGLPAHATKDKGKGLQDRHRRDVHLRKGRDGKRGTTPGKNGPPGGGSPVTVTKGGNPSGPPVPSLASTAGSRDYIDGAKKFTGDDKSLLGRLVDGLPPFLSGLNIRFVRGLKALDPKNPGGYDEEDNAMILYDFFFSMTEAQQRGVLIHELAHQWHRENPGKVQDFMRIGWDMSGDRKYSFKDCKGICGSGRYRGPSRKKGAKFVQRHEGDGYSASNPIEDFGVSLQMYVENPDELKRQSPERFNWFEKNMKGSGGKTAGTKSGTGGAKQATTPKAADLQREANRLDKLAKMAEAAGDASAGLLRNEATRAQLQAGAAALREGAAGLRQAAANTSDPAARAGFNAAAAAMDAQAAGLDAASRGLTSGSGGSLPPPPSPGGQ
jgi:hypothetical protein